jgi:hypothetical protein
MTGPILPTDGADTMARCQLNPPVEELPPRPREGGSYVLSGGRWLATQQTVDAAPAEADAEPQPVPTPED